MLTGGFCLLLTRTGEATSDAESVGSMESHTSAEKPASTRHDNRLKHERVTRSVTGKTLVKVDALNIEFRWRIEKTDMLIWLTTNSQNFVIFKRNADGRRDQLPQQRSSTTTNSKPLCVFLPLYRLLFTVLPLDSYSLLTLSAALNIVQLCRAYASNIYGRESWGAAISSWANSKLKICARHF